MGIERLESHIARFLLRAKGDNLSRPGYFSLRFRAVLIFMMAAVSGCTNSIIEMGAERAIKEKRVEFLEDGGLHAFLCGTGIPFSVKGRAGACTAVLAGGQFILVDAGQGSWANIADEQLPVSRLSAILLTHFHSDHIAELGEDVTQSWMRGRRGMLDVYGPEGVEQVVAGFDAAYALDRGYRTTEYGPENMPPEAGRMRAHTVKLPTADGATVVLEKNGLRVIAFAVNHDPTVPAYGYRFEFRGKVLVISGDTSKSENLIKHASNADVLIHEVVAKHLVDRGANYLRKTGHRRFAEMAHDAQSSHTSASEAVDVARQAKVKKLVFTHLAPALSPLTPDFIMRWVFFGGFITGFNGSVIFGKDGMWVHE